MEAALLMDRLWPEDDDLESDEFRSADRDSTLLQVALLRWLLSDDGRHWCRLRLASLLARIEGAAGAVH
jgi:hypothetical protein